MIEVAEVQEGFEDFAEYGRIRRIVKSIDPYGCVFYHAGQRYAAFSTGLTVCCEKYKGLKTEAVRGWLAALYLISRK